MLIPTSKSKEKIKIFEELPSNFKDLIRLIAKNSDDDDKKYMKTKFNSHDELPLNKKIKLPIIKIVVRDAFHENNKFIHRFF